MASPTQWKRPVEKLSAPEIHTLRLVPGGVGSRFCIPLRIHQKPTLGFSSSLVSSWKNDPGFFTISRTSSSLARFCSCCSGEPFSGGTGRGLLQRNHRDISAACASLRVPLGLVTLVELRGSLLPHSTVLKLAARCLGLRLSEEPSCGYVF